MTFSDTVAQQRDQQEKTLKRFIAYSLLGSFALHSVGLRLRVNNLWQPAVVEPEAIVVVVTEPAVEELTEVPPEETVEEPDATVNEEVDVSAATSAATFVESPAVPESSVEEPEPPPPLAPLVEETEEPALEETEEPVEDGAEDALADPTEDGTEPEPRNLSDLLNELRRARDQARQTAANGSPDGQVGGTGSPGSTQGDRPSTTATAPTGSGADEGGQSEGDRPRQRRSREVTCRGCNFDYPENANGAEGSAQVVVETDAQGRVVSVILSRPTGNPVLDRAAIEQARRRVRLTNVRAGESYPIDIDFVQPGSEAARRIRERDNRRSIIVSDDEPENETPETSTETTTETTTGAGGDRTSEGQSSDNQSSSSQADNQSDNQPDGQTGTQTGTQTGAQPSTPAPSPSTEASDTPEASTSPAPSSSPTPAPSRAPNVERPAPSSNTPPEPPPAQPQPAAPPPPVPAPVPADSGP